MRSVEQCLGTGRDQNTGAEVRAKTGAEQRRCQNCQRHNRTAANAAGREIYWLSGVRVWARAQRGARDGGEHHQEEADDAERLP